MPDNNCFSKSRKHSLIVTFLLIIVALLFITIHQNKNLRITLADKRYLRQYVKIEKTGFRKIDDKNSALVMILIDNSGNRIMDSLLVEINYYDRKGKFLDKDTEDILEFTKSILLPMRKKLFEISVSYPKDTTDVKVRIIK